MSSHTPPHSVLPGPALDRYDRLRRTPVAELTDGEKAYMEAYDLAKAYPGPLGEITLGIFDALFVAPSDKKADQPQ